MGAPADWSDIIARCLATDPAAYTKVDDLQALAARLGTAVQVDLQYPYPW